MPFFCPLEPRPMACNCWTHTSYFSIRNHKKSEECTPVKRLSRLQDSWPYPAVITQLLILKTSKLAMTNFPIPSKLLSPNPVVSLSFVSYHFTSFYQGNRMSRACANHTPGDIIDTEKYNEPQIEK